MLSVHAYSSLQVRPVFETWATAEEYDDIQVNNNTVTTESESAVSQTQTQTSRSPPPAVPGPSTSGLLVTASSTTARQHPPVPTTASSTTARQRPPVPTTTTDSLTDYSDKRQKLSHPVTYVPVERKKKARNPQPSELPEDPDFE